MADVRWLRRGTRVAEQGELLLGDAPVLTLLPDPADGELCCSVRFARAEDGLFVGLVLDKSLLAERVRLGMGVRFVMHHAGATPLVKGEAEAQLHGRLGGDGLEEGLRGAVERLVARRRTAGDLVVLSLRLSSVQVDDGESPAHGAVPRT